MSNFWDNNIPDIKPQPIPWGVYNLGSSVPDINGWIKSYGPDGSSPAGQWEMVVSPTTIAPNPSPTTTVTLSYNITTSAEPTSVCWGTLWFAFVPYNVSTGSVQGGSGKAQTRIYLLQIDSATSNNQSGWYYMDRMSQVPVPVGSLSIGAPPSSTDPVNLWVYFDYEKKRAYAGMGPQISVGQTSIDDNKGVKLSDLLQSSDSGWGYLLAFAKLDAGDPTSSDGGIGPVRIWTDDVACCFGGIGGVVGTPPGSMNCSEYSPGGTSCNGIVGTINASPAYGYCGVNGNVNDPLCGCQNGDLGPAALNYCFATTCGADAYRRNDMGKEDCSTECVNIVNIETSANVDLGKVTEACGFIMSTEDWEILLAMGIGVVMIILVIWLFWTGWL